MMSFPDRHFWHGGYDKARGVAVEARTSATRLLEEVPLSPDERAAAEGDVAALDGMLAKLREVPALDGRTLQEISSARDSHI